MGAPIGGCDVEDLDKQFAQTHDRVAAWLEAAGEKLTSPHVPDSDAWYINADDGRPCTVSLSQSLEFPEVVLVGAANRPLRTG